MFKAAVIPGLILAVAYVIAIVSMAVFFPNYIGGQDAKSQAFANSQKALSIAQIFTKVAPFVTLIVLVLGGIYGGLFTPTEAGAVGAMGALIISLIKRKLSRSVLWEVLSETGHIVASILLLIVAATMYSRMLAISGLPAELGAWIANADMSLASILTIYVIILIIMGTILDTTSIILIMVPLFLPAMAPYDINFIWFGIITVFGAEIGLLTPPLGISCYVIKTTLDDDSISLYDIFAGAFPFAIIILLVLILLIVFPEISLVLL